MKKLFFLRAVASLVDGTLIAIVGWIVFFIFYSLYVLSAYALGDHSIHFYEILEINRITSFQVQLFEGIIELIFYFYYYSYLHAYFGQTLGKKWMGIRVIDLKTRKKPTLKRSFGRTAGYIASYLPFGAGFMMAFFHQKGMGLHDTLSRTGVVRSE